MLDFSAVRRKERTVGDVCADLTPADLRRLTDEMVDTMLALVADCTDADVTFEPHDPEAEDPYAEDPDEALMPWTLGHVIVHVTASSEEAAYLAAELARCVPHERRRSRYEVPWRTTRTIADCRARLEESRRMRLASLDMWPDSPHLANIVRFRDDGPSYNAIARFALGLMHDEGHLGQIAEIVRQARAARA